MRLSILQQLLRRCTRTLSRKTPSTLDRTRHISVGIITAFFAWGSTATAQTSTLESIRNRGEVVVAVFSEDVSPFFFVNADGVLDGIDPVISRDIGEKLGVKVVFNRQAETFDGIIDEVVEGRADIALSLLSDTLDRAMRVNFTRSYVSVRQFLLINRLELGRLIASHGGDATTPVPTLLNSDNARIGVISGTSYVGFLAEDFPFAEAVEYESWDEMLAAVKSGELVALMYDEIEIGNWRLADPAGALELRPYHIEGHPDTISIAVPRDSDNLLRWLNLYLEKSQQNGFLQATTDTYLHSSDRTLGND